MPDAISRNTPASIAIARPIAELSERSIVAVFVVIVFSFVPSHPTAYVVIHMQGWSPGSRVEAFWRLPRPYDPVTWCQTLAAYSRGGGCGFGSLIGSPISAFPFDPWTLCAVHRVPCMGSDGPESLQPSRPIATSCRSLTKCWSARNSASKRNILWISPI
jgi:hypothetical protein